MKYIEKQAFLLEMREMQIQEEKSIDLDFICENHFAVKWLIVQIQKEKERRIP